MEDLVAFFEDVGDGVAALEAPGGPLDTAAGDGERFADLRALAEAIARAVERGDAPTLRRILEAIQARTCAARSAAGCCSMPQAVLVPQGQQERARALQQGRAAQCSRAPDRHPWGAQDEDTQADLASMLAIPVAQHGHAALVHLLDAFGADLEEVDDVRGGPPLMHAANNGHSAAVNALVAVRWGSGCRGAVPVCASPPRKNKWGPGAGSGHAGVKLHKIRHCISRNDKQ